MLPWFLTGVIAPFFLQSTSSSVWAASISEGMKTFVKFFWPWRLLEKSDGETGNDDDDELKPDGETGKLAKNGGKLKPAGGALPDDETDPEGGKFAKNGGKLKPARGDLPDDELDPEDEEGEFAKKEGKLKPAGGVLPDDEVNPEGETGNLKPEGGEEDWDEKAADDDAPLFDEAIWADDAILLTSAERKLPPSGFGYE